MGKRDQKYVQNTCVGGEEEDVYSAIPLTNETISREFGKAGLPLYAEWWEHKSERGDNEKPTQPGDVYHEMLEY